MASSVPKRGARIAKVRLPPDLASAIDTFAEHAQSQTDALNTSGVLRMLLRLGLAANDHRPIDLRSAAFSEGYAAGHGQAVEAHQRALYDAKEKLAGRAP
jgi:hypothetical protein